MSTLQELLNLGLVPIGSEDSRFEKIKSTSSELVTTIREDPTLLIPATLIALDGDVQEAARLFSLVEDLLMRHWNTLRNTHVDRPYALLRSIIIDALGDITRSAPEVAGAVWNTAASRLRHGQVSIGKPADVVSALLQTASDDAESEAVNRAGLVLPTSKTSRRKKANSRSMSWSVDGPIQEDDVLMNVVAAAGPHDEQGETTSDPNPYWPDSTSDWSYAFAPRMAASIVEAINLGASRLAESLGDKVSSYLASHEAHYKLIQRQFAQYHEASKMRLDVLWWSESLYSPSRRAGYLDLPISETAVTAAMDLVALVPPLAPASVCYVLLETVQRVAKALNITEDQSIADHLQRLSSANDDLGPQFAEHITDDSYVPLLSIVSQACLGRSVSAEELRSRAGLDGTKLLSAGEFAMWVFRDLQAKRLVDDLR